MINDEQAHKIEAMISEIESRTRAEIVTVVCDRSSAVGHVPWVLMALLGFVFLSVEGLHLNWQEAIAAILIAALSFLLSKVRWIQRWLTPNEDEIWQVQQRAELEFHRAGIAKTDNKSGVLIFVSLMERRAVVLADQGVSSVLPEDTWIKLVQEMAKEFRRGDFFGGMEKAIKTCGMLLVEKLPLNGARPKNQLPNRLLRFHI